MSNKFIKWHMYTNMLPAIAIYLALKKFNTTVDKAYDFTDEILQIVRFKIQKKNKYIGLMPFGYYGFKLLCKSIVKRQYPDEGWSIEWIIHDTNDIHFDMKSCIYFETTKNIIVSSYVHCSVQMMMLF